MGNISCPEMERKCLGVWRTEETRKMNLPRASNPISIGGPEAGENRRVTSPSSSPLPTLVIPGMDFSEAAWTSELKAFRVMAAEVVQGVQHPLEKGKDPCCFGGAKKGGKERKVVIS
jgi:hypothetical protein